MMSHSYWEARTHGNYADPRTNQSLTARDIAARDFQRAASLFASRRQAAAPPLTGEEALEMVLAAQMVDKQDHNAALETTLARLAARPAVRVQSVRCQALQIL